MSYQLRSRRIAVGTIEETEGPPHIRLLDAATAEVADLPALQVADRVLLKTSGNVAVSSMLSWITICAFGRGSSDVRVRVFVNHSTGAR